jgi:transposase-like protein
MTLSTLTMERAHDEAMDGEPNLPDRPRRRRFSAAYKLSLLEKYDRCVGDGDKGALLRREGLYSSHIVEWRRARDAGALVGLTGKPRKDRPAPEQAELTRATRRAERAEAKLAKARQVIEIQGKVSELLEQLLSESDTEPRQPK